MTHSPFDIQFSGGQLHIRISQWPGFHLASLCPVLTFNGAEHHPAEVRKRADAPLSIDCVFGNRVHLSLQFEPFGDSGVHLRAALENTGADPIVLNRVDLLKTRAAPALGAQPEAVVAFEQGNYWGRVRPILNPLEKPASDSGEAPVERPRRVSDLMWVAYDRSAKMGCLTGFLSSERWIGQIELIYDTGDAPAHWRVGFDAGDLHLEPGAQLAFEDAVFLAGADPWNLLETYAEIVRDRHKPKILDAPPVSWCSWYPYRLSVTQDRVLENARIAAQRLKPLGLHIIEVDLGWERANLPGAFEENERFSRGLGDLSAQLHTLGFDLGVWKAPYTISEFDPLFSEHPEWLISDPSGAPIPYWTWFWEPHGKVFILDLTRAGAQQWLREQIAGLHTKGVRYFKADFIGCASHPLTKNRQDKTIVMGGGLEAPRIGAQIIREALPEALLLNCGGAEMPGTGHWPIFYACNDTGNTGFQTLSFQHTNHQALACHLFKNRRWGILQPSCLCVGLPGTLEEARFRATQVFLAGGQVDISDTLTTLPEDRWQVLTATLPPLGLSARPVDLFDPIFDAGAFDYSPSYKGREKLPNAHPPGSVWHLRVETDWDTWDLVGLFAFSDPSDAPRIERFVVPFERLNLPSETRWAYEFWSGQFLGAIPQKRINANGYGHPGDIQDLSVGDAPNALDIAFFGPCAKLLCLRKPRPHPWVLGTGFHQSGGVELQNVRWNAKTRTLSGQLHRPAGQTGYIAIAGGKDARAFVSGRPAPLRQGANGSWIVPVITENDVTPWEMVFEDKP